jgi:hypothetical protein
VRHLRYTQRTRLRRKAASNANGEPPATRDGLTFSPMLALDGREVGMILGISHGPQIGTALRWLQAEVEINPELNTTPALTALLRFGAPLRTFGGTREDARQRQAKPADCRHATRSSLPMAPHPRAERAR